MAYTHEELKHKPVAELREIAQGVDHEAVHGFLTMHKDHLVPALCKALGIDMHEHHVVVGLNKGEVKMKIRGWLAKRDEALKAGDSKKLRFARREIHRLKRRIHKATV